MKALLLAGAASFMAAPAFAGPYVNAENNAGFTGSDFDGSVTELHLGYEGDLGESAGYYVQAGPAIVAPDGDDATTELSGKSWRVCGTDRACRSLWRNLLHHHRRF